MEIPEDTKRCNKCGRDLPLSAFHRCITRPKGRNEVCRQCRRAEYVKKHGNGLHKYTDKEIIDEYTRRFGQPRPTTSDLPTHP